MSSTVFVNGSVFDGHRHHRTAGPVAVTGGRIAAVGATDLPAGSRVVDLDGGLLAPGFVDAHVHAVQGGLERTRCDLSETSTRDDYLAAIKAYAEAHPDRPWILGGGWMVSAFPGGTPTAADLARKVTVNEIERHLYTAGSPDPDFIIRTSGEVRLSGFLLWQAAYSEYYFCDAFWPSLCSTRATLNPGASFATTKALMPFLPAAGSVTANRMVVLPTLALEMNCFDPLMT